MKTSTLIVAYLRLIAGFFLICAISAALLWAILPSPTKAVAVEVPELVAARIRVDAELAAARGRVEAEQAAARERGDAAVRKAVTGAIGVLVFYFLPAITAAIRQRQPAAIFILNLFLGWTVLGWIIALIWAATNERQVHYVETDD
jgi:hypothetical protein